MELETKHEKQDNKKIKCAIILLNSSLGVKNVVLQLEYNFSD